MSPVAFTWSSVPIHVIDFEGSARTGVVEFGVATLLGGEVVSASTSLHASRVPIPAIDTQCHGLGAKELKGRPPFESEWERWVGLRRTGLLAAHNASVESGLLRGTWSRPSAVPGFVGDGSEVAEWGPWIDTCRLARAWAPSLGDFRLGALVSALRLGPGWTSWPPTTVRPAAGATIARFTTPWPRPWCSGRSVARRVGRPRLCHN